MKTGMLLTIAVCVANLVCTTGQSFQVNTTSSGTEIKWSSASETCFVNTSGGPSGFLSAARLAMNTWSDGAKSSFVFIYGGSSSSHNYGSWDGVNLIDFGPLDDTTIVAQNTFWYNTSSGQLFDSDIRFNSALPWSTDGSPSSFDVQNVATHELGHSLSLADLYLSSDSEKTMYGYTAKDETKKRSLDQDDINGIAYLYPLRGTWLSIASYDWDDDNDNGVIETGENITLRVKFHSSANVSGFFATLTSSCGDLNITDNQEQYPSISAGGDAWPYGTGFDMVLNMSQTYNVPFTIYVAYTKDGYDYYQTFSFNKTFYQQGSMNPSFAVMSYAIDDSTSVASYNNGDGIIQSGESVQIRPKIKNIGQSRATDVEVYLTYTGTAFNVDSGEVEAYPDLDPNQQEYPSLSGNYSIRQIREDYSGSQSVDMHVRYAQSSSEYLISGGVEINVQPASWILVSPVSWDFGRNGTTSAVTKAVSVCNAGSASLQVTAITPSHTDCSWTGPSLPWTIASGASVTFTASLDTAAMSGQISRQFTVTSNGRIHTAGQDNVIRITGFVSDERPSYVVPNTANATYGDIGGAMIVWSDGRNGSGDIYGYDLRRQEEIAICTNSAVQSSPRVSGNLVAWTDRRNEGITTNYDIYGYDLTSNVEFAVSTNSAYESYVGVDQDKISFLRKFHTWTEPSAHANSPMNLYYYDHVTRQTTQVTAYSYNGHNPMYTVDYQCDFGGGVLTWRESYLTWDGSQWRISGSYVKKLKIGVDSSPVEIVNETIADGPTANDGKVAWGDTDGNGYEQVYYWDGSVHQITTNNKDHAESGLALGSGFISYSVSSSSGFKYYTLPSGPEGLLTSVTGDGLRMDNRGAVWFKTSPNEIRYSFFGVDLGVSPGDIQINPQNPTDTDTLSATVTVHNVATEGTTDDITVKLYRGHPFNGGVQIGIDQILSGGIAAGASQAVTFASFTLPEGSNSIFAICSLATNDYPVNNMASQTFVVADSDIAGPIISNVVVSELNGDGDGKIGSDESIRISWNLSDASGIGSTTVSADGTNATVQDSYYVDLGPLSSGTHAVTITATDGDDSPASSQRSFSFQVVSCESISIFCDNRAITNDSASPVNLGFFSQNVSPSPVTFIIRNDGDQNLSLGSLNVTGSLAIYYDLIITNMTPSLFTTFALKPITTNAGTLTGMVTLTNSDTFRSPFTFTVRYEVNDLAPTDISLSFSSVPENQSSGTRVGIFITTDPNRDDAFSYSLVGGSGSGDNDSFTISGGTLCTATSFDYETKNSYSIRVRSTDQTGLWYEKVFAIQISNVNETPTDISLSNSSVAEKQPSGTTVGTFGTTDPDSGNTFIYSLVSGTGEADNSSFAINGSTLKTAVSFDYETKNSYSIRVRSTDQGGLWTEKVFTLAIRKLPDVPTRVSASDGTYSNKVQVIWNAVSGAVSYEVWRNTSDTPGSAGFLGTVTGTNYDDTAVSANTLYYYRVKTRNAIDVGLFSASDSGYAGRGPSPIPAPTGVSASDGVYTDKVHVTWNVVSEASFYEVWRSASNNTAGASNLGTTATTAYDDMTVATTPGTILYYWVKTKNNTIVSDFSYPDSGYCRPPKPSGSVDLSISSVLFDPVVIQQAQHPRLLMLILANNGPDAMNDNPVNFAFYLSENDVFGDGDDYWMGDYNANKTIHVGGYTTVILSEAGLAGVTIPPVPDGNYYVFAKAQHASTLMDPAENNNVCKRMGTIQIGTTAGLKIPVSGDFDGDGKTDLALYNEATGTWQIRFSGSEYGLLEVPGLGGSGLAALAGDLDGDGREDPAIYNEATGDWIIWNSQSDYVSMTVNLGGLGFKPVLGNYNGGDKEDLAVYQEASGYWLIILSETTTLSYYEFGMDGYIPVTGDFDGDGKTDLALYERNSGNWHVKLSSGGGFEVSLAGFGGPAYVPVIADYDGDGLADLGLYHKTTGSWMVRLSAAGYAVAGLEGFGGSGYVPVPGDFDGDGLADLVIYETATSTWTFLLSSIGYAPLTVVF